MKTSDIVRRAGRGLRHAKGRTILTALAIGVGAFTLTLTLAVSTGAKDYIDKIINDNFDPAGLIVTKEESIIGGRDSGTPREFDTNFISSESAAGARTQVKSMNQDDLNTLKNTPGIESLSENVSVNAAYITRDGQKKYIATLTSLGSSQRPELLSGELLSKGEEQKILLPEAFLPVMGFKNSKEAVGKNITVAVRQPFDQAEALKQLAQGVSPEAISKDGQNNLVSEDFTIAGVMKKPVAVQPGTELNLYVSNSDSLRLNEIATKGTSQYQKFVTVQVKVKNGEDPVVLKDIQQKLKDKGFYTLSAEDTQKFLLQIIGILQGIVIGFGFITIIASVFGIINTQYISVLERTQQIGLMKALGMSRRDIAWLFRFEAAWIGLLGGLLGSLTAVLTGTIFNPIISEAIKLGEGERILIFQFTPIFMLVVGLMLVAVVSGILPARKAGKLDPVEALRTE